MGALSLRAFVEAILVGNYARAEVPPPLLEPGDRAQLARRALDGASPFRDPRELALSLGLRIYSTAVRSACGELTDGRRIFYRWSRDEREWGMRLTHGVAHCLLLRTYSAHTEADAWLLTAELLAPARALRDVGAEVFVSAQPYAPRWLIDAWQVGGSMADHAAA